MWLIHGGSDKAPFEDRVLEYLRDPDRGLTVEACARSIGISEAAVYVALANLEAKGIVAYGTKGSLSD